jgi:hypothetical protein
MKVNQRIMRQFRLEALERRSFLSRLGLVAAFSDPLPNPEPPPGPDPGDNPPVVYPILPPSGPSGPGS